MSLSLWLWLLDSDQIYIKYDKHAENRKANIGKTIVPIFQSCISAFRLYKCEYELLILLPAFSCGRVSR